MALSIGAQKLLKWLNIYHIRASVYNTRIGGTLDRYYNVNWIADVFATEAGKKGRTRASPQRGLFKTVLAELVSGGY